MIGKVLKKPLLREAILQPLRLLECIFVKGQFQTIL